LDHPIMEGRTDITAQEAPEHEIVAEEEHKQEGE
jgi:hypothetical protein